MRIATVPFAVVAELIGKHRQADLPKECFRQWVGIPNPKFADRYELMATAMWLRYCQDPRPSYSSIAEQMESRQNYVQELVHDGLQLLLQSPRYEALEPYKDREIEAGTQFYVDIFGCELRCCSSRE